MAGGVDVSDFDQFEKALQASDELAAPIGEQAIGLYLTILKNQMEPYPAQPDRDRANPGNKPSPYNKYVRGVGQFPRSSFEQVNNQWQRKKKGAYKKGPKKGKVHYTSQKLNAKWRLEVNRKGAEVSGELRNEAAYSALVLGHKPGQATTDGIAEQAAFHGETGWANLDDSLAATEAKKNEIFGRAVDRVIARIAKGS